MFDKDRLRTSGYDLHEIENDKWTFDVKDEKTYTGTFKQVVVYMIEIAGFNAEIIEEAITEMIKRDHNGAHFGIYKRFIFSFVKEINNGRKAS